MSEEKNPEIEKVFENFIAWLRADWTHMALIVLGIILVIMLIALLRRR